MKDRRGTAVELLMSHPDATVAEMLGVKLSTLREWMATGEFSRALRRREREQAASLARIARQTAINAAASLCQMVSDLAKPDAKLLLEVLKVSGAFEAAPGDGGETLAEIIARAAKLEESCDEKSE